MDGKMRDAPPPPVMLLVSNPIIASPISVSLAHRRLEISDRHLFQSSRETYSNLDFAEIPFFSTICRDQGNQAGAETAISGLVGEHDDSRGVGALHQILSMNDRKLSGADQHPS